MRCDIERCNREDHERRDGHKFCVELLPPSKAVVEALTHVSGQARAVVRPDAQFPEVIRAGKNERDDRADTGHDTRPATGLLALRFHLVHLLLVFVDANRDGHADDKLRNAQDGEAAQAPSQGLQIRLVDDCPRQQRYKPQKPQLHQKVAPAAICKDSLDRFEQVGEEHPQPEERDYEPNWAIDVT